MQSSEVTAVPADGFKIVRRGLKRARLAIVPEAVTFRADEVSGKRLAWSTFDPDKPSSVVNHT